MKKTIFIIALLATLSLSAQEKINKFDFKAGSGIGFMGDGDLMAFSFENELNYKLNNYFSTSLALGIGRSLEYKDNHNDYLQGSLNLFISPFRNDKRNNFKIGLGYTLINETICYKVDLTSFVSDNYAYSGNTISGFNFIIEDEYKITSKFLIGGKLFVTGEVEYGGIISGGMIKLGIVL